MAQRYRTHRGAGRVVALLCLSLSLLLLAGVGDALVIGMAPVVHAASGGVASACGDGQGATAPPIPTGPASITLGHSTGPPGMMEVVTGIGWPGGAQVSLDLDVPRPDGTYFVMQSGLAAATTGPDGAFAMPSFIMPDPSACGGADPGSPVAFVVHTPDNNVAAKAAFIVTAPPTLGMSGNSLPQAGAPFQLQGSGWEPNAAITISISVGPPGVPAPPLPPGQPNPPTPTQGGAGATPQPGQQLPSNGIITANADGTGALSATYTLPTTLVPRSLLTIQATGKGPRYGTVLVPQIQEPVLPAVMPAIALNRSSGTVTDAITVRGTHWYPGDSVNVTYCRGQVALPAATGGRCQPEVSETLTTVTVDASGGFTTSVHLPSDAQTGDITIQALVPNDIFGLSVYAQDAPYTIVPPPLPWDRVHPRLAFALSILKPALPALAIALLLVAAYLWNRLRNRRARQPAAPAAVLDTHAPTGTPSTR